MDHPDAVDRAWEALDEGRFEDALEDLSELDPDEPDGWIPSATALTELGELDSARELLDRAWEELEVDDDPDWMWAEGTLLLREWRLEEARTVLERLHAQLPDPATCDRLAVCADLHGDTATADRLLAEAARLDPEGAPLPPRLSDARFDALVQAALEELPPEFREALDAIEIIVEAVPARWMIDPADPAETPPDLLGLFVGHTALDRPVDDGALLPPRVYLFKRNLERACHDSDELAEELRVTLYHELAHALGFDEDGVAEMGLE